MKKNDIPSNEVVDGDADASTAESASTTAPKKKVGYGNPPKATQWKPGQSGNPKGKKKGGKSLKQYFLAAARKKIVLKDAKGEVKEVSQLEALIAFTFTHAIKGNHKLTAQLLALAKEFFPPPPPETAQEALDKLDEALKACPGYFVITPNQVEAVEKLRRLYGPGADRGKGPKKVG